MFHHVPPLPVAPRHARLFELIRQQGQARDVAERLAARTSDVTEHARDMTRRAAASLDPGTRKWGRRPSAEHCREVSGSVAVEIALVGPQEGTGPRPPGRLQT